MKFLNVNDIVNIYAMYNIHDFASQTSSSEESLFVTFWLIGSFPSRRGINLHTRAKKLFFFLIQLHTLSDVNMYVEEACLGNHCKIMNNVVDEKIYVLDDCIINFKLSL